ncbi:MAG: ethanolamine ammonia-lyase reactivating factor EutA, partial [Anaerolineaceae bacterium]
MNDTTRQMLSVGIDIGTTTTQLVFSRLMLSDQAVPGQIPRVQIHDRQVIYRSPVAFTPLVDAQTIDAPALAALIQVEYQRAGVIPAQVETGAAIITGETARKK